MPWFRHHGAQSTNLISNVAVDHLCGRSGCLNGEFMEIIICEDQHWNEVRSRSWVNTLRDWFSMYWSGSKLLSTFHRLYHLEIVYCGNHVCGDYTLIYPYAIWRFDIVYIIYLKVSDTQMVRGQGMLKCSLQGRVINWNSNNPYRKIFVFKVELLFNIVCLVQISYTTTCM